MEGASAQDAGTKVGCWGLRLPTAWSEFMRQKPVKKRTIPPKNSLVTTVTASVSNAVTPQRLGQQRGGRYLDARVTQLAVMGVKSPFPTRCVSSGLGHLSHGASCRHDEAVPGQRGVKSKVRTSPAEWRRLREEALRSQAPPCTSTVGAGPCSGLSPAPSLIKNFLKKCFTSLIKFRRRQCTSWPAFNIKRPTRTTRLLRK